MTDLLPWNRRPAEVANLLNPAYFAVLINNACDGYKSKAQEDLPYPLPFIALPLLLYPDTAETLPKTSSSRLHIWLQQNPEVLFDFAERANRLAPYIREGISFGISHKVIQLAASGRIVAQRLSALKGWEDAPAPRIVSKQAHLVGKMFGQCKDVKTLFSMFGVTP